MKTEKVRSIYFNGNNTQEILNFIPDLTLEWYVEEDVLYVDLGDVSIGLQKGKYLNRFKSGYFVTPNDLNGHEYLSLD